jgi:hypothetical protein
MHARAGRLADDEDARRSPGLQHWPGAEREVGFAGAALTDRRQ